MGLKMTEELASQNQITRDLVNYRIASVVLSYNSYDDLVVSVPQLAKQRGVEHTLVIVDNASCPESVGHIRAWLADWKPDAVVGTQIEVNQWVRVNPEDAREPGRVYFIKHHENLGYSAGNNIGIRLADSLGMEAVLIANPDMRVENPYYLKELTVQLFSDEDNYAAASRIVGPDGKDQNPLREPGFWEELLWPRAYFSKLFGGGSYVLQTPVDKPQSVPKVSGCCQMLRMDFLRMTNNLDQNVFLYCEEPILSARVKATGGKIIYIPTVTAVHAHIKGEKGNPGKRMLRFIKSRRYYLQTYSGYQWWQLRLLDSSYGALAIINLAKCIFAK